MMTFQLSIDAKCLYFEGAHLCFEGARLQARRNNWEDTPALAAEETRGIEQEDRSPSEAKAERQIGFIGAPEGAPFKGPYVKAANMTPKARSFSR
jgi:hypothetical protein